LTAEETVTRVSVWPAPVRRRVFRGDFPQRHLDGSDRSLVIREVAAARVAEGETVFVTVLLGDWMGIESG
jgi:hypothetical protein